MAKQPRRTRPVEEQAPAPDFSGDGDPMLSVVVSPMELTAEADLAHFWTADAMAEAEPIQLPETEDSVDLFAASDSMASLLGQTVIEEPKAPDGQLATLASGANSTTSRVSNLHVYPYAAVGKLFMTFGGRPMVGSAWVIDESTVITAGHCIYDPDTRVWAKNVVFAPRYQNGSTLGQWAMKTSSVLEGWQKHKSFAHDVAAVILTRPVRPTTGAAGWMANVPASNRYLQIGYPAQPPFDGTSMWQADGRYLAGESIITVGGDMTPGCSGGPMFVTREGKQLANGVNSHRPSNQPQVICTPYFGDNILKLVEWLRANGGA